MKLSIIVISYNEAQYLGAAIESCLTQNFDHDLEIIIGDDGSSDGSIAIIEDYQRRYPDIIRYFVVNRGNPQNVIASLRVSNVIKRGFSLATGDYLMVMSGDDLLIDQNKCSKQLDFLEKHSGYSGCYTNYLKFWDDGVKEAQSNYALSSNAIFWSRYYVHITCFVFRRSVIANLTKNFCDDTGLIFSILKNGKIKYLPMVAFGYRQRPVSIMSSSNTMDLYLLETLLLQDILESKGYLLSTLARYCRPMIYLYRHRELLQENKYAKYLIHSKEYKYDLINMIAGYEKLPLGRRLRLQGFIAATLVCWGTFDILRTKDRLLKK